MVGNGDIKREFNMFSDIWNAYKTLLPVGKSNDEAYWDKVTVDISTIMEKYPGPFAKELALAVLGDLERRCAENEDQDKGR